MKRFLWAVVFASLWIHGGAAFADVGGTTNSGPVDHEFIAGIIEDSDPVGSWRRVRPIRLHRAAPEPEVDTSDGRASVIHDPSSGRSIAAWSRRSLDGFDVVISRFDNGAWSAPSVLAAGANLTVPGRPRLVMDPSDGSVHLLYQEHEAAPRIMHRQAPADLSSWSAPVQVSQTGEIAMRPAGTFHDGALHVVYESHGPGEAGTPRLMILAVRSGSTFTTEVIGSSTHEGPNWIEVHSDAGRLWVDWIDADDEMAWTRRRASGSWEPIQIEPYSGGEQRNFRSRGRIKHRAID